ncbi:MAG TPA: CopD family protein [Candidatus Methylomirabilis sp.]|nr:CopD family protein [Candidatus Methylomirabilis sp.]
MTFAPGRAARPGERAAVAGAALLLWLLLLPAPGNGTEEFSRRTGKECAACHVDPSGGGELTAAGNAFLASLPQAEGPAPVSRLHRGIRFAAGFLHLITAVMWFGTILYVHLLLKPAYAARGLPRGELLVGWGSIIVMAVTGTVLTAYRIPAWDALFHTRFGILLTIKIAVYLVMTATAFVVTFIVGPRLAARHADLDPRKRDLTPAELSSFAGKDGAPAWFAYRGTIYDATGSKLWGKGSHMGKHQAGFDLTETLKFAPHGEDQVLQLPVVGKLVEKGAPGGKPPHLKAFYFMTFLNLFLVIAVLLVIAMWRWW